MNETWTAIFWCDGEMPHEIATRKLRHQAEFEAEKFTGRMINPDVGVWWVEITSGTNSDSGTMPTLTGSGVYAG